MRRSSLSRLAAAAALAFLAGCASPPPAAPRNDGRCPRGVCRRHVRPEELEDGANEGDRGPWAAAEEERRRAVERGELGASESDAPFRHPRKRFRLGSDE